MTIHENDGQINRKFAVGHFSEKAILVKPGTPVERDLVASIIERTGELPTITRNREEVAMLNIGERNFRGDGNV